jgi:hypothetical protein
MMKLRSTGWLGYIVHKNEDDLCTWNSIGITGNEQIVGGLGLQHSIILKGNRFKDVDRILVQNGDGEESLTT